MSLLFLAFAHRAKNEKPRGEIRGAHLKISLMRYAGYALAPSDAVSALGSIRTRRFTLLNVSYLTTPSMRA
jgi:hypothetical protein